MHKFWESWKIVNLIPDQTKKRQKGLLGWRHKVRTWTFHFLFWSVAHLKSFCQNMQTRQAGEFWGESFDIFPTPGQGPQKAFGRVTKAGTTRKVPSDWLLYGFWYLEEGGKHYKQKISNSAVVNLSVLYMCQMCSCTGLHTSANRQLPSLQFWFPSEIIFHIFHAMFLKIKCLLRPAVDVCKEALCNLLM